MKRHKPRRRAGMALGTVLVLTALVLLTFMTMTNLSMAAMRLSAGGRDKAIALSLAEAGVDHAAAQIKASVDNNYAIYKQYRNTWQVTGAVTSLSDADGQTVGQFKLTVANVPGNANQVDITSTGIAPNGKTRQVRAKVAINGLSLVGGAMLSNGGIKIRGNVTVQTVSGPSGAADIRANGDIVGGGSALIGGDVAAAGTVDKDFPSGQSGAPRIDFPTAADIADMRRKWEAAAKAAGTMTAAEVLAEVRAGRPIMGPKYISGDITLDQDEVLSFTGNGPFYVAGSIDLKSKSRLTNMSDLVVEGAFKQRAGSEYAAVPALLTDPPPTLNSLSTDNQAIELAGHATHDFSVVYALRGGISVTGNTTIRGSLVAGSEIELAIDAGGNYTHNYLNRSLNDAPFVNRTTVTSWIEM